LSDSCFHGNDIVSHNNWPQQSKISIIHDIAIIWLLLSKVVGFLGFLIIIECFFVFK